MKTLFFIAGRNHKNTYCEKKNKEKIKNYETQRYHSGNGKKSQMTL